MKKAGVIATLCFLLGLNVSAQFFSGPMPLAYKDCEPYIEAEYSHAWVTMQLPGEEPVEYGKMFFSMGLPVSYKYTEMFGEGQMQAVWVWNEFNRLEGEGSGPISDADNGFAGWIHNYESGRLVSSTMSLSDGSETMRQYDYSNDRCQGYTVSQKTADTEFINNGIMEFSYDSKGNISRARFYSYLSDSGEKELVYTENYEYNSNNQVVKLISVMPDGSSIHTYLYKYNAKGLLIEANASSLAFGDAIFTIEYFNED
jgi:hypothetical protein